MKITIIFIIIAAVLIFLLRWVLTYFTKKVVGDDEPKPAADIKEEAKTQDENESESGGEE